MDRAGRATGRAPGRACRPRASGKSTWLFTTLPLWAAANGWRKFIAAFADSTSQAEMDLATFKHELDTNTLLRRDFADLCTPASSAAPDSCAVPTSARL